MFKRKNIAVLTAELLGTALLTFSILAVSRSAIGVPYFIAIGVGLTVAMLVLVFGRVAAVHVNPAVTIGLWTVRKVKTIDALLYIGAQFVGAVAAVGLYNYLVEQGVQPALASEFDWKILVAELVGTFVFTIGVAAAVFNSYENSKLAATVGISLTLGIIVAGVVSSGILNPAAALGLQLWEKAYIIGPVVGSVLGINLYVLLFAPENSLRLPSLSGVPALNVSKKKAKSKKK